MAKPDIEALALEHLRSVGLGNGYIRAARLVGQIVPKRGKELPKELSSVRTRAAIQILHHCDRLKHLHGDRGFHGFELARAVRAFHDAAPAPRAPRITTELLRKLKAAGFTAQQAQDRLMRAAENGHLVHGFGIACQGSEITVERSGKAGKISLKGFASKYSRVAVSR